MKKKKLLLIPIAFIIMIVIILVIVALTGSYTLTGDVKDKTRQNYDIKAFTEIVKKERGDALTVPTKASDYSTFTETDEKVNGERGYMVKMTTSKIKGAAGSIYKGSVTFWTDKKATRYSVKKKLKITVLKDNSANASNTQSAKKAAEAIKQEAIKAGYSERSLDVEANGVYKGAETIPAVDVILMAKSSNKATAKKDGEKLKAIVLKHVRYGSVKVQTSKILYEWMND